MFEISVVIPTYNRLDRLRYVIPALLRSDLRADQYELVVADSNSNDGTAEYLAEIAREHPNVRHLPGPYTGRAMARNAGIDAARADIVLFTDADIVASPDLLSRHLERHKSHLGIAVVGLELQVGSYEEYEKLRDRPYERRPLHPNSRKRLSWLYFLTGNASVRRDDLIRLGKFDESFTGYGHEDLELGYRIEADGMKILYEPRAVNYHWHPVPYAEQKERMKLAGRSTVRFYRKHSSLRVQTNLGMTFISLGLHGVLAKSPGLIDALDRAASSKPGLARNIIYQYHYVSGIKDAMECERA